MNWYLYAEKDFILYQGLKGPNAESAYWTDDLAEADYYANGPIGIVRQVTLPADVAYEYVRDVGMLPGPSPYASVFVFPPEVLKDYHISEVHENQRMEAWKTIGLLRKRPNYTKHVDEELRYETTVSWGERIKKDGIQYPQNSVHKIFAPHEILEVDEIFNGVKDVALTFGPDYVDVYSFAQPVFITSPQHLSKEIHYADRINIDGDLRYFGFTVAIPYTNIDTSQFPQEKAQLFDTAYAVNIIINVKKINP